MLDSNTLSIYKQLKNKMDAAYKVFKKDPSVANASRHTAAAQAFTTFCIDTMATLVGDVEVDHREDILANIEQYLTCTRCGEELLFQLDEDDYIESGLFVPEFPGWCYSCLVKHCVARDCESCTLTSTPDTCSYREIKNIYKAEE